MSVRNFRDVLENGCYDINASILMFTALRQCFGLCPAPYDAKHFSDRFISCLAVPFCLSGTYNYLIPIIKLHVEVVPSSHSS